MHEPLMLHIWNKGKKSLPIYRMSWEVHFAFLSREEKGNYIKNKWNSIGNRRACGSKFDI